MDFLEPSTYFSVYATPTSSVLHNFRNYDIKDKRVLYTLKVIPVIFKIKPFPLSKGGYSLKSQYLSSLRKKSISKMVNLFPSSRFN